MIFKMLVLSIILMHPGVEKNGQKSAEHDPGFIASLNRKDPEGAAFREDMRTGTWTFQRARYVSNYNFTRADMVCQIRNQVSKQFNEQGIDPTTVPGYDEWNLEIYRYSYLDRAVRQNLRQFNREGKALAKRTYSLDPGYVIRSTATAFDECDQLDFIASEEAMARILKWVPLLDERYKEIVAKTALLMVRWADLSRSS